MNNQPDNIEELGEDEVLYCANCHSLLIVAMPIGDGSYCGKCNCTIIRKCTMDEWLADEEKKKKKHG